MPILGNGLQLKDGMENYDKYGYDPLIDIFVNLIGDERKKLPKMFTFFRGPTPLLVINDPDAVNDLYITKNKYFDKSDSFMNIFFVLTG